MRVLLSNLAHIKKAEIKDQHLTIIVGDNGAGKTLLLETISFLKDYYQNRKRTFVKHLIDKYESMFSLETDIEVNDLIKQESKKNIQETSVRINITSHDADKLNIEFKKMVEDEYSKAIGGINENVLLTDESSFSFKLLDLDVFEEKEEKYYLHVSQQRKDRLILSLHLENEFLIATIINLETFLFEKEATSLDEEKSFRLIDRNKLSDIINRKIKEMFLSYKYDSYFGSDRILYLPTERNSFMDNALMKAASDIEVETNLKRRYSERLFTASYLNFKHYLETFPNLVDRLTSDMEDLFGGQIKYGDNGEISSIVMKDGKEIRRELFSTKQNRLIPYLLINQPISRYSEVIIEEPEAHLSLKSQKEFLSYLNRLLKKEGKKFYITTHSDVFFQFLNNMLLKDPSIQVNVYELLEDDDECYFLDKKERTDYGYEINMFTHVLNELYDESLKIQNKKNS